VSIVFLHCDSYGVKGYRVTSADEFSHLLHECLHTSPEGPKLIEVKMHSYKSLVDRKAWLIVARCPKISYLQNSEINP